MSLWLRSIRPYKRLLVPISNWPRIPPLPSSSFHSSTTVGKTFEPDYLEVKTPFFFLPLSPHPWSCIYSVTFSRFAGNIFWEIPFSSMWKIYFSKRVSHRDESNFNSNRKCRIVTAFFCIRFDSNRTFVFDVFANAEKSDDECKNEILQKIDRELILTAFKANMCNQLK